MMEYLEIFGKTKKIFASPELHNPLARHVLTVHDADVLSSHHDPHWQPERLDDLRPPNIVQDQETVRQVTR